MLDIYVFKIPDNVSPKEISRRCREKLYLLLEKKFLVKFTDGDIGKGKYGKPFIKGREDIHFNISHAKGECVIAISDKKVGVDMEGNRAANLNIAERYFTENERNYIREGTEETKSHRFFTCWTRKEAYMKWTGKGFAQGITGFDVIGGTDREKYHTWKRDEFFVSVYSESIAELKIIETRECI